MPDEFPTPRSRVSRRIVFHGLGALGVAAVLAGCSGSDDGGGGGTDDPATQGTTGSDSPTTTTSSGGAVAGALAETSEIPVGGGLILTDERIVITQPSAGEFVAFSSICKHQGFDVTSVEDGEIRCSHHGSVYDAETGDVENGPAPTGLDEVGIKVEGTSIVRA